MSRIKSTEIYHQLKGQFTSAFPDDEANKLQWFSERVFKLFPLKEIEDQRITDVSGFIQSLYSFIGSFDEAKPKTKVFNPNLDEHGWESPQTQIFILQQNMAFLVDSVLMALNKHNHAVHNVQSTQLDVLRDEQGNLLELMPASTENTVKEVLIFFQIDPFSSEQEQHELESLLAGLLGDVQIVNDDFIPALSKVDEIIEELKQNYAGLPEQQQKENLAFIEWLKDEHFTFLGYTGYSLINEEEPLLHHQNDQSLGLFRGYPRKIADQSLISLSPGFVDFYQSDQVIILTKSSRRSHIHRDTYCDYVVIKRFDKQGKLAGEHRFLGLYTSTVYSQSPFSIPLIRQKLSEVYSRSDLDPSGYDGKNLRQIIEAFPRDELFHGSTDHLFEVLIGVWQIKERKQVKLFMRPDLFEKFVSCIVYFPKDTYHTDIRLKTEQLLMAELDASASHFSTYFGESALARTYFVFRINSDKYKQVEGQYLEESIALFARNWTDDLQDTILDHWGDEAGLGYLKQYKAAFPVSYQDNFDPRTAVHDLALLLTLSDKTPIAMSFYQPQGAARNTVKFKVFHRHNLLALSDLVPMLENLGFRVLGEHPYKIKPVVGPVTWMHEFTLEFGLDVNIEVSNVRQHFQDAFEAVWLKIIDDDSFNHLIVGARLDWQSVALLRMYARFMKQIGLPVSQEFIADTLALYPEITRNLIALFKSCFDPKLVDQEGEKAERTKRLEKKILESLDDISNLNEDQVLRTYLQLVCATLRTSFFQREESGNLKPYISVKLASRQLDVIPEPRPEFEVFVYSPRMEGVHLRTGKIARGGLRWSDRLEDYRTEVLGLVKAQQVKNSVIVPAGAKGGFVAKTIPANASRDQVMEEGIACYKLFIAGLLDITDNLIAGEVVPPPMVIRMDGDDPYLVVAADKGTASFSDIANAMSEQYRFWLNDAFASGGSNGYDHKKMGITARGAWVAVQRHFLELGVDIQKQDFTVIGIGDMSGDVFGNGMLLSEHIKLVAAFNHEYIFLDPTPDCAAGFKERKRLFQLPRSSWSDYSKDLLSEGGGIFSRRVKAIPISLQVRALLNITDKQLTPSQLIKVILSSSVDLIWNGGIGTYVKSTAESHLDVGDRVNEELRVNGSQLQCKVFGEGGNLGMTQLGRIEFALSGGACNTDFIDNAGGVDCSDIEVNIKIVLNQLVENEDLTRKQRNVLLQQMTDAVSDMVLKHNFRQTQGISLAQRQSRKNASQFLNCLQDWEQEGLINRDLEKLPSEEGFSEREKSGASLTRPELSVLVSHAKIIAKEALVGTEILDDPYILHMLYAAFPAALVDGYAVQLNCHKLRHEIIANQIANEMIDLMGLSFVHRQKKSTGATTGEVACGYIIARDTLGLLEACSDIESNKILTADKKLELLGILMRLGRRATRWMVRNRRSCTNLQMEIDAFKPLVEKVLLPGEGTFLAWHCENELLDRYQRMGLGEQTATLLVFSNDLFFTMGLADTSIRSNLPIDWVGKVYQAIDEQLSITWFAEQIVDIQVLTRWEDHAREAFMDDLEHQFRSLVSTMLQEMSNPDSIPQRMEQWQQDQKLLIQRWLQMVEELRSTTVRDFAMFSVALRELLDLVDATTNADSQGNICSIGNLEQA